MVHIIVSGHVQGVGFRYSAREKALEYNLVGWAQNKSDGTVEMEIEGDMAKVEQFIDQIQKGLHRFIRVDDLTVNKTENKVGYKSFVIK